MVQDVVEGRGIFPLSRLNWHSVGPIYDMHLTNAWSTVIQPHYGCHSEIIDPTCIMRCVEFVEIFQMLRLSIYRIRNLLPREQTLLFFWHPWHVNYLWVNPPRRAYVAPSRYKCEHQNQLVAQHQSFLLLSVDDCLFVCLCACACIDMGWLRLVGSLKL